MLIRVRTFAVLRELSVDREPLELPEGATLADAWRAFAARHPRVEPYGEYVRGALNGAYAEWDVLLADGDEVAWLPPVSGGAGGDGGGRITPRPIDVAALEAEIAALEHGAIVTFVGRARRLADDGREVVELDYEAFTEMAERVLTEIVSEADASWPGSVTAVAHRTGRVPLGEVAVAIVTAAPHRAEAFAANRFVIEAIKDRLPIWKRERFTDGSEWKRAGA
jgi:molybdopterin synthase catalytic subunit